MGICEISFRSGFNIKEKIAKNFQGKMKNFAWNLSFCEKQITYAIYFKTIYVKGENEIEKH